MHDDGEDDRRQQHAVHSLKEPSVVETGLALQRRQDDAYAPKPARVNAAISYHGCKYSIASRDNEHYQRCEEHLKWVR